MTIPLNEIGTTIFRRAEQTKLSDFAEDMKTFIVLGAIDGKRTIQEIASKANFDLQYLEEKVKVLYDQGFVEKVDADGMPKGQAKKILDAIIQKRSRGVGAIAKTLKIKLALKGINPERLTPNTPDDPVLLKKLVQLARSYGLKVQIKPEQPKRAAQTRGKTKLMLDSIITQCSGGDPQMAKAIKSKLNHFGVDPDAYSLDTNDDFKLVNKLIDLAHNLGVTIPTVSTNIDAKFEQFLKA